MNSPKLTIQIVGWNSEQDLPKALKALKMFPLEEVVIKYIDNDSHDNSVQLVEEILPNAKIIRNTENLGFSGGHNIGFKDCETPLVMLYNPDLELYWPAVKELLSLFDDPKIGSVQGKLYRDREMTIIDSAGVELSSSLNGVERGANKPDEGQFNQPTNIIAATGACAIYRMKALKDTAHSNNEYFDNDFFAYKEDVDLGWRLNKANWIVKYQPASLGVHKREVGARGFMNWGLNPLAIFNRLRNPRTRYSLRNYVWMIAKNATFAELIIHSPIIFIRLLIFFVLTLFYPPNLKIWIEIITGLPKIIRKRHK